MAGGDLKALLLLALGHLDSHSLPWDPTWWTVVALQIQGEAIPAPPFPLSPFTGKISPKGPAGRLLRGSTPASVPSDFHLRRLGAQTLTKSPSGPL